MRAACNSCTYVPDLLCCSECPDHVWVLTNASATCPTRATRRLEWPDYLQMVAALRAECAGWLALAWHAWPFEWNNCQLRHLQILTALRVQQCSSWVDDHAQ
jgi:hypothetical protein